MAGNDWLASFCVSIKEQGGECKATRPGVWPYQGQQAVALDTASDIPAKSHLDSDGGPLPPSLLIPFPHT